MQMVKNGSENKKPKQPDDMKGLNVQKKYLFCESEHRPKTNCLSFKIYDRVLYQRKSE